MTNYSDYKVEDFVADHFFKSWVLNPDRSANLFWENWLNENQQKVGDVKMAREILLGLSRYRYSPSVEVEDEIWNNIESSISEDVEPSVIPLGPQSILARYPDVNRRSRSLYYGIAAAIALVVMASLPIVVDWNPVEVNQVAEFTITEKENPRGQKSTVFLPDGSKVFLNSESKISYDSRFNTNDRVVHLTGEAFFEVAEDASRPFTVVTEYMSTTALGTSFNVNAYEGATQEVSLMTGKVRVVSNQSKQVEEAILYPGELAICNGRSIKEQTFNLSEKALWRNRIIYFKDTPLDQALNVLERWYDVSFEVKGQRQQSKDLLCTGQFEDDYLSNVLESLSYTLDFQYKIDGKRITLEFNPKQISP
ncbi:FecR family protein [Marinoscillum sp. MHG1-6]|uniref:FecR family protein n=1 Tax=Marinoscillum sp. MHG1-6 TaxID=2959627 RepID=UPI0021586FD1|nr:FecR family protein [Marinoscillum sp. MHG1-6]